MEQDSALFAVQARWLEERLVGHPGRTVSEPAAMNRPLSRQRGIYMDSLSGLPEDVTATREEPTWTFRALEAGYWPML